MNAMYFDNDRTLRQIKRLIDIALYSLLPVTMLFVIVSILTNSLTILNLAIGCGLGIIVRLFAFIAIRAIMNSNIIKFPFGTGKLENFSGFLYGVLVVPSSLYLIYLSVFRIFYPAQTIFFTITQIPMLVSLVRNFYLYILSRKLKKQVYSPMVDSYFINFKVMMDLPLPEEEQIKIMSVLAREFENYEGVGNILTRRSGRQRFLDIELFLKEGTSLSDISLLQFRMQKHLEEHFREIKFNLIPLLQK